MTHDPETALRTLGDLRARLGVRTHLDDFGSGASSLSMLHRFPGDVLKIDHGLVLDMVTDPGSNGSSSRSSGWPTTSAWRSSARASRPPSTSRSCACSTASWCRDSTSRCRSGGGGGGKLGWAPQASRRAEAGGTPEAGVLS